MQADTASPAPSEPCQAELHMLPFCSYPGIYFFKHIFSAGCLHGLKKKIYLFLYLFFISFFLEKCGNQKAHGSQHTMTWPALLDPAQPEPGCGHALNRTIPLAAPEAKAAFPSDTNNTQVQPFIVSPQFSPDLSTGTHGALAAECCRWTWVMPLTEPEAQQMLLTWSCFGALV